MAAASLPSMATYEAQLERLIKAPRALVWAVVSDTNRWDRAAGLAPALRTGPVATMPEDKSKPEGIGRASGIGVEFAVAVAGLSLLGYWIDRRYGSSPWGLLIGLAIGLIGGTYNLIRESLIATQEASEAAREKRRESGGEREREPDAER